MISLFLFSIFILLYYIKLYSKKSKNTPLNDDELTIRPESFHNDSWDFITLMKDSEKPEIDNSLNLIGKKIIGSNPPLKWILEEHPASLCLFTLVPIDLQEKKNEASYEFWKFINEPGAEILLTEAASDGYLPAMSLLSSKYANIENFEKADYWEKIGVAHLNPSSILNRGLNLAIKGKMIKNNELSKRGENLIILSYMLGEERASEITGFEKLRTYEKFNTYSKEDVLNAICEIEKNDESKILEFLKSTKEIISNKQFSTVDCISIIKKINDFLDDPKVTIREIATLLPFRKTFVKSFTDQSKNNPEILKEFERAELLWRYRLVGPSANFVDEAIIPMICE
jgi:hypothetical protein